MPDKKQKQITLILCIFGGFLGLHHFYNKKIGKGILYLCTVGLFYVGWIHDIYLIATDKYDYDGTISAHGFIPPTGTPAEQLQALKISNPNINLKPGETCYYMGPAQSCKNKVITTGYKGTNGGLSFRVAKGVYLHGGKGNKKAVRETVSERHPGTFYVTDQRLILLSEKNGFNATFGTIIQVEALSDGLYIHQSSKTSIVLTKDSKKISYIINLMNQNQAEN